MWQLLENKGNSSYATRIYVQPKSVDVHLICLCLCTRADPATVQIKNKCVMLGFHEDHQCLRVITPLCEWKALVIFFVKPTWAVLRERGGPWWTRTSWPWKRHSSGLATSFSWKWTCSPVKSFKIIIVALAEGRFKYIQGSEGANTPDLIKNRWVG